MTVQELIERLEAASVGSSALDADVYLAKLPDFLKSRGPDGTIYVNAKGTVLGPVWEEFQPWGCPRYTTSLDAALTLVPEGWNVGLDIIGDGSVVCLTLPGNGFLSDRGDTERYGQHKRPAVALCIAALRARNTP